MNSLLKPILIVEDDLDIRAIVADILELNGFLTTLAGNGQEGLIEAKRETPEMIITDLAMPIMDGFAFLEELRLDPDLRAIPVIVTTAKADRVDIRRGMELGASDFITKPFTEDELLNSIVARLEKKELLDEIDAFAHTVAHDLKNPLTTLMSRLELADMMFGEADEETTRNHLAIASKSARRLNGIIDSLLVLAGVRKQTVEPEALDMGAVAAEAVDSLEALLQKHSAKINLPDAWPASFGYAPWIAEVWLNLVINAAKYGGDDPLISLGGETSADGSMARFWVQDAGPGLDAAAQAMMFIPFTHISTVQVQGHGLGLSIVRRIIEKLGGKLGVESVVGEGARFWFELPTNKLSPAHGFAFPSSS